MSIFNYALGLVNHYETMEQDMCKDFTRRKEQAISLYWDACKYPRKKKKKLRKQAKADFELYSILEQPITFN